MNWKIKLSVLLLPLSQVVAQQPDSEVVMEKSRELGLAGSLFSTIQLTITEKNGATRNRTISMTSKSYPGGAEKRFIKFLEPPDVKGTSMLIIDNKDIADEMWIYLPALKKTRRLATSDKGKSFMSSEFSNADMSSPPLADFRHKHLENSGLNNQWIIESTPVNEDKADEYGYSRKISLVNTTNYQILKMEFYNFDNKLFKIIEIRSVHNLAGGKYLVKDMVATNLINNRKSEITFTNIREGASVDDSVFSLQALEK